MPRTVCLNVFRHPELPVRRGDETYDQFIDRAWRAGNDAVHPERAGGQVAAAVERLLLTPGRPLVIRHSPTVRARRGAELFRQMLTGRLPVTVYEEAALAEPEFDQRRIISRAEFEAPTRTRTTIVFRLFRAIVEDDAEIVAGGRAAMAERVAALRRILATGGPANHLWVSHAPVMPFIYMGVVERREPAAWTYERATAIGLFDYAGGFSARVMVDGDETADERR